MPERIFQYIILCRFLSLFIAVGSNTARSDESTQINNDWWFCFFSSTSGMALRSNKHTDLLQLQIWMLISLGSCVCPHLFNIRRDLLQLEFNISSYLKKKDN